MLAEPVRRKCSVSVEFNTKHDRRLY